MKAKTVAQVLAAEAGGKTRIQRYNSMLDIASAAYNRAKLTGTTIKDVVSVKSQFNAYNSAMPPGTAALTALAEQALSQVEKYGPVHPGTYYATPATVANLPAGLVQVPGVSAIHTVFTDPQNRPVVTAVGTKRVNASLLPDIAPTPTARPTQLAALSPQAAPAASALSEVSPSAPGGLQMTPEDMQSGVGQQALRSYVESVARTTAPQYQMAAAPAMAVDPGVQSALARALAEQLAAPAPATPTAKPGLPGLPGLTTFANAAPAAPKTSRIGSVNPSIDPERFAPGATVARTPTKAETLRSVNPVKSMPMAPQAVGTNQSGISYAVERALAERLAQQLGQYRPGTVTAPAPEGVALNSVDISLPGDAMLADSMAGNIDAMQYAANKPAPSISPPNPGSLRGMPSAASKRAANLAQYQRGTIPRANVLSELNKQLKEAPARYAAMEAERAKALSALSAPAAISRPTGTPFSQQTIDQARAEQAPRATSALSAPNGGVTAPRNKDDVFERPGAGLTTAKAKAAGTPTAQYNVSMPSGLSRTAPSRPATISPPNPGSVRNTRPTAALSPPNAGSVRNMPSTSALSPPNPGSVRNVRPTAAPSPPNPAAVKAATDAQQAKAYAGMEAARGKAFKSIEAPKAAPSQADIASRIDAATRTAAPAPAASTTYAPGTKPANPSQLGGITMADPKGLIGDQLPSWATQVEDLGLITQENIAPTVMPAFTQQTINEARKERTPTYSQPKATAYDVYSGRATVGVDNTGKNTITRNPDGTTSVTNQYGVTTTTMRDGKQAATGTGLSAGGLSLGGLSKGVKGVYDKVAPQTGLGKVAAAVTAAGLGGLPGIAAGLAAGKLGDKVSRSLPSVQSGIKSSASKTGSTSTSGSKPSSGPGSGYNPNSQSTRL